MRDHLQELMGSVARLEAVVFAEQRKQAQQLAAMSRLHGVQIFQSGNLEPYGVSILVGPKLWEFIREYLPASVDRSGEAGETPLGGSTEGESAARSEAKGDAQ